MRGKKKHLKYSAIFVLAALCACFFSVPSMAADGFLEGYEAKQGTMKIYCRPFTTEGMPAIDQFNATLSSGKLPVTEVSTVGQEKIPITFYCLVDVSGSMGPGQIDQAKAVLLSLCSGLREGDNMVIGSLGNDLSASGFLTDKNEISAVAEGLAAGNEDTNLYAGIVKAIEVLNTDSRANQKKCLLVISDGEDDQKSGITKGEAEQAVSSSAVPVYTVAALPEEPSNQQLEAAKVLGSFARLSVGGVHYVPAVDGQEAAALGGNILQNEEAALVLTADTSGIQEDKDVLLLRVAYAGAGQNLEDTMDVLAEDLQLAPAEEDEPEPAPTKGSEPEPAPTKDPEPKKGQGMLIAVAGAGILLLVAAIAAAVKIKGKKKEEEQAISPEPGQAAPLLEPGQAETCGQKPEGTKLQESREPESQEPLREAAYEVKFTAIGYEQVCFTVKIPIGRAATMGRDKRSEIILNPQDKRLSGIHCKICCAKGMLNIWDLSANGTFVNGVPVKKIGMASVEDGQMVRMGSYEYRVSIGEKVG